MAKAVPLISIVCDTREQRPWELNTELFAVERGTLTTGDYTIAGLQDRLAIERKSLGDFVGTVIHDWMRFRKELYRLAAFDVAAVVVEADLSDIWEHRYESEAKPESVIGRIHGIWLDHGVPVYLWGQRSFCVPMVERFLIQAQKKLS